MADHHPEHKPGSMDIRAQEKTFAGFLAFTKWGVIIILALLIFLALVGA
ncbi:aa3-type cytochrome c oxidase subunit IV [Tabrizicola sp. TH137]|nr:aa3-type cytochrome c oxidase subunit IV [Tabrizicola sp. TH137]PLL14345.1 aa3-type cytochrome c oxidase subunit IV [Tabrizicola sp. TH137]